MNPLSPEKATAVVTGGSRGIGAAAVRALARDGFHVGINYLSSAEKALALAAETVDSGRALAKLKALLEAAR